MEENKFLKILWLCGFIAFAAVSCWATTDSLQLLQPDWPAILCWIVTVGFFVVASIGSKLIGETWLEFNWRYDSVVSILVSL